LESRKKEEREFQNRKAKASLEAKAIYKHLFSSAKFYSIGRKSLIFLHQWAQQICPETEVLDHGCGTGQPTFSLAQTVVIYISEVSIGICRKRFAELKVNENLSFFVMDTENLGFRDETFDFITCKSILHHLDITIAYTEFARVLKSDGQIVCREPLAYNPIIRIYRKLTPHLRTSYEAEHILNRNSIRIAEQYFGKVETRFYGLATLVAVPFRNS
jgi:ubiquinone/menaquinone biosynthesis C-methylase UbiE